MESGSEKKGGKKREEEEMEADKEKESDEEWGSGRGEERREGMRVLTLAGAAAPDGSVGNALSRCSLLGGAYLCAVKVFCVS